MAWGPMILFEFPPPVVCMWWCRLLQKKPRQKIRKKIDLEGVRTLNPQIWNLMRYHCATKPCADVISWGNRRHINLFWMKFYRKIEVRDKNIMAMYCLVTRKNKKSESKKTAFHLCQCCLNDVFLITALGTKNRRLL